MHTPLAGLRVLDASRVLAGPFCAQLLGDLGADVLKLERPGSGDDTRAWGPPFFGEQLSAYYLCANRNKRAIAVDLSKPEGLQLFHDLVNRSDVLIENFRTDSAAKMGLAPKELLARHPRVVACSITGFGQTGPLKNDPGYDLAIQAMSGLMSMTGPPEGPPCKVGVAMADILTGMYAAVGILAGLHARQTSGHGYHIDLALLDPAIAAQINLAQAYLLIGKIPPRPGNTHFQIVPYALFAAIDGWVVLNVGNDSQWQHFCKAAEAPELANDPRFTTNPQRVQHRDDLFPRLNDLFATRTVADWCNRLEIARVPHSPVNDYAAVFASEQVLSRGMKVKITDPTGQPVDLLGSPFHWTGAELPTPTFPPKIGEHTEAVLREVLGLDAERVAVLRSAGVVA